MSKFKGNQKQEGGYDISGTIVGWSSSLLGTCKTYRYEWSISNNSSQCTLNEGNEFPGCEAKWTFSGKDCKKLLRHLFKRKTNDFYSDFSSFLQNPFNLVKNFHAFEWSRILEPWYLQPSSNGESKLTISRSWWWNVTSIFLRSWMYRKPAARPDDQCLC